VAGDFGQRRPEWLVGDDVEELADGTLDAPEAVALRVHPAVIDDGVEVGRLDGRLLASHGEAHVAVVAPTRFGKTTRCVVPWLLEHDGPASVTSTKTDIIDATRAYRERLGRVQIWDPFGASSALWTPTECCEEWGAALLRAQWPADAVQEGESEIAAYWRGEAAKLLAPLLHAAAVDERPVDEVLVWVDSQEAKIPGAILGAVEAEAAKRQLDAVTNLDPRNHWVSTLESCSVRSRWSRSSRMVPVGAIRRRWYLTRVA
jgi:hypothetical protein